MNRRAVFWMFCLIVSGAFCIYVIGNQSVGLFDRDEPRYAQTSRQMLQSGDWVVPHFLDKVRTAKPVLIYWCQAASMKLLGDNAFAARLPSAVAMTAVLGLLIVGVSAASGAKRGLWTAFILGSSGLAIASAKMCLTDAVLLLWITLAQVALYQLWRNGPRAGPTLLLGISLGLAGLTKGPVAIGVSLTTLAALWLLGRTLPRPRAVDPASPRRFTLVSGLIVVAVVVALIGGVCTPWLWAIQHRAPEFLRTAIGHDVIDRMQHGQEGHSAPPGFYSLIVWVTFFPWSLLLPGAIWCGWRYRHLPATRFALAAWFGPWILFECIATKLPHYVLPTYPALAYLTADFLARADRGQLKDLRRRGFRAVVWGWAVLVGCVGLGAPILLFFLMPVHQSTAAAGLFIAVIAIVMGVTTARRFGRADVFGAARAMGVGMLSIVLALWSAYLPGLRPLHLSQDIAHIIIANGGYGQRGYMIDYKEPSLAFAQGGGLREQTDDAYLNDSTPADWPQWITITQHAWDPVRDDVKNYFDVVGSASGVNYSNGGGSRTILVLHKKSM